MTNPPPTKVLLQVQKTATVFTHGSLNQNTQFIWILLHGYGQTGEELLAPFLHFPETHYFIAPEALNHFYSRGFGGRAVANWMTSRERDSEIKDYLNYLDSVYEALVQPYLNQQKVIGLGFSQGVATLTRWAAHTTLQLDELCLVAGDIGNEFHQALPTALKSKRTYYLQGNHDEVIPTERKLVLEKLWEGNLLNEEFEGKHELNAACVALISKLMLG